MKRRRSALDIHLFSVNLENYMPDLQTVKRRNGGPTKRAIPWTRRFWDSRETFLAQAMTNLREDFLNPVLFLDDMAVRHATSEPFMQNVLGIKDLPEVWRAQTAERALDLMQTHLFHAVFLDHDLADEHYGEGGYLERGTRAPDGSWLAKQMLDLPDEQRPALVVVHSWNPDGARYMTETLRKGGFNVQQVAFGAR